MTDDHQAKVDQISSKVTRAIEDGKRPTIYHGSTHSVREQDFTDDEKIHIERLDEVIEIDEQDMTAVLEPDISMRDLVDRTLEHDMLPAVVMELPGITVGGGIQGGAGESSSFRHGLFHKLFNRFELVTGDGSIMDVSTDDHPDLFYGTMCSYGSLGILTAAEMNLIPARDYVKLRYITVDGFTEAVETIKEQCSSDADFVDAIMFEADRGVVMVGELSDEEDLPVTRFTRARDRWFYSHASDQAEKDRTYEELIPVRDYFFRYDRGGFWAGEYFFDITKIPSNRLTKLLCDPVLDTSTIYDGMHASNLLSKFIGQDICTKIEEAPAFLDWIDRELDIYPLWLCPIEPDERARFSPACLETDLVINIGIWGRPTGEADEPKKALEAKAAEIGSRKTLYAQQFYSEQEFWEIYDEGWYRDLRETYGAADVFTDIYAATHVEYEDLPDPSVPNGILEMAKSYLPFHD